MIMLSVVICLFVCFFFFFKQKTAYEMRISDWSSDVCSSDLVARTDDCRHGPWSLQRDHRPARCRHKLYADDLAQLLRPGIPCPARGSRAGDPGSLQPGPACDRRHGDAPPPERRPDGLSLARRDSQKIGRAHV